MRLMPVWIAILTALVVSTATAEVPSSYGAGAERFASEMAHRHGFDRGELAALLGQAKYLQAVVEAMRRPYEAKPWYEYRPIFLTKKRIQGGVAFWRQHRDLLERAHRVYGVPPQIITAIIGVETNYGANLGKYRVIDALSTLGFSYPERAEFFRKELEQFLLLSREDTIDALAVTGSYAGALGLPQFIPSSYRAFAVDFDQDGRRDLWRSVADVVGSVANYLERQGWEAGEPVAFKAIVAGGVPNGILPTENKPRKPETSLGELRAAGITMNEPLPASTRATLIRLDTPEPEYWLGLENFYMITRYNQSNLYAMAVYQLSDEIQAAYEAGAQSGPPMTDSGV